MMRCTLSTYELARVQAQRFSIEYRFREAKSECSMVDYQVRRWDAWHHHMALVMLKTLVLGQAEKSGAQAVAHVVIQRFSDALGHLHLVAN